MPFTKEHRFTVPRICITPNGFKSGCIIITIDTNLFGLCIGCIVIIGYNFTVHRTGIITITANFNYIGAGFGNFGNFIKSYISLFISTGANEDIIDFDGVQLGNFLKVIFGGNDHIEAVVFVAAVDITLTVDFVDGEG